MKSVLMLAGIGLVTLALAACGVPTRPEAPPPAEPVPAVVAPAKPIQLQFEKKRMLYSRAGPWKQLKQEPRRID